MQTLGYRFRPWTEHKSITDGSSILRYLQETAQEHAVNERVRLNHRVVRAEWSTPNSRWTVEVERPDSGDTVKITCGFLYVCSGYFRYDEGYTPKLKGLERFSGQVIHPQHWPEEADYTDKRIVVIGSGATAVTLAPALAQRAAHVTMLQRSPSYVVSVPAEDPLAKAFRHRSLKSAIYPIVRWKNVLVQALFYRLCRRWPNLMRQLIRLGVKRSLPSGYDIDTHFEPRYDPWDQRLCIVPDGDLFEAISNGHVEVVTDQIKEFTEGGIRLESGSELEAELVVTATGLNLLFLGGIELVVDEERIDAAKAMTYKGMMLSGIPNLAFAFGYTNAAWTLKVDLTAEYVCRLVEHMEAHGNSMCVPEASPSVVEEPLLDFSAGFVLRALNLMPKQGSEVPWRLRQNYPLDLTELRFRRVDDGTMRFTNPAT
jgi:monooxygenase